MVNKIFDKILILIALLVLIYLIDRQIKINEKTNERFENDSRSFIGMKKGDSKTLLFYNPSNRTDDKYQIIRLPTGESIKQYVYEKSTMVILTTDNKIYYCMNCDFISGNIKWELINNNLFQKISRISLNDDRLFVLGDGSGLIKTSNDFSNPFPKWTTIAMPSDDTSFKYMDAQYNHLVAIGALTNFIYHKDITPSGLSQNWTIMDKSKIMNSIKVTLHGYIGKTSPNELYQCKFPCDGSTGNMWNLINSDLTSSINANSEVISLVKNNTLFSCDTMCSQGSMTALSDPTKYNLFSGQVLDFVYPKLEILPTLAPLDEAKSKVNQTSDKIKNKIDEYQSITNGVDSINKKIQQFKNIQYQFDMNYNTLSNQRDKLVDEVMNKVGVSNVEQFADQVLLKNIMNKVKKKVSVRSDEKEKEGAFRSSLIVSL
jgi:hypothetical protein